MNRRNVKVTAKHVQDCKDLLSLMGVPWIQAPGEAEAQCAALVTRGIAYAAGSEDMDTLTFGTKILLRHLTFSEAKKMPIMEINLNSVLEGLDLTMDQFIDLCILLGCDYCDSIKGIGPQRALSLIKLHGNIESILNNIDDNKHSIPIDWNYKTVRKLFTNPHILSEDDPVLQELKWDFPDSNKLIDFMVDKNGFSEVRIKAAIEKLVKSKKVSPQGRIDSFFNVVCETKYSPSIPLKKELKKSRSKDANRKSRGLNKK